MSLDDEPAAPVPDPGAAGPISDPDMRLQPLLERFSRQEELLEILVRDMQLLLPPMPEARDIQPWLGDVPQEGDVQIPDAGLVPTKARDMELPLEADIQMNAEPVPAKARDMELPLVEAEVQIEAEPVPEKARDTQFLLQIAKGVETVPEVKAALSPGSAALAEAEGLRSTGDRDSPRADKDEEVYEIADLQPVDVFWDKDMRTKFKEHQIEASSQALAQGSAKPVTRSTMHSTTQEFTPNPRCSTVQRLALRIVSSNAFLAVIMFLILLNLVILGLEVDAAARLAPGEEEPATFQTLNIFIVMIFFLELILKFLAFGCFTFFCGAEKFWNIFDLIIISTSLMEVITDVVTQVLSTSSSAGGATAVEGSHLRILRFMRLARALRGVRVMRLLRFIGALRSIVFAILSTLWSLLWTLVLLVLLFYCFGVILAQLVSDHCRFEAPDGTVPNCTETRKFWSSVPESMMTLFLSISGGLSWVEALDPLRDVSELAAGCLIVYIFISTFAILNVVTGVFCNNAIDSAKADKDIAIMKQIERHKGQLRALKGVFQEIDEDCSRTVNINELKTAMSQQKLSSFMESMDISTQDIWTLFMILDTDASGEISFDEFVNGCMQLQGPAQSVQIARMRLEHKVSRQLLNSLGDQLKHVEGMLRKMLSHPPPKGAEPILGI